MQLYVTLCTRLFVTYVKQMIEVQKMNENIRQGGGNHPDTYQSKVSNYTISLPILHPQATITAENIGCKLENSKIIGTVEQIESFMAMQNPMYQSKYNSSKHLNGAWNPLSRKLELHLPEPSIGNILMSASVLRSDKTVSTGFMPVVYDDFTQVGEAMHSHAHSASIYSPISRWDTYKNEMKWDYRRRLHNISFIGNVFTYDFDNGVLSFDDAVEILKTQELHGLVIRSKSDPKYEYDRFKMLIKTDFFFPAYPKDKAPEGFQTVNFNQYKEVYIGLAKKYGLWEYADQSTTDPSRLIAQVNNADYERREYVAV